LATLTADICRERLIELLNGDNGYQFLNLAGPYLQARSDDTYMRMMAAREYLKLRLVEPARELLDAVPPQEVSANIASVQRSVRSVPSGAVPWSRYQERFESNLADLAGRAIDVAGIRAEWARRQNALELFCDAHGVHQVRLLEGQGRWRWIPFLGHHPMVDESRPLPDGLDKVMPLPVLVEGLDLGWFFERIYRATQNTFLGYSCALLVVEPDPALFAVVLHLHDWRALLRDSRVFFFVGPSAMEELSRVWDQYPNLPFPGHAIRLNAFRPIATSNSAAEVVERAGAKREREIQESWQDIQRQYAERGLPYWATRFDEALRGTGKPLRILSAVSTHTTFLQHSMRDAKRAMEELGHACVVLTERADYEVIGPLTFHKAIRDFDPDVFFCIDHLRPEFSKVIPTNLPILTWDQDQLPHVFTKENLNKIAAHDFVAGCSKPACVLAGCDPRQFLNAHVPTSAEQFSGPPLTPDEEAQYACDVSYVSHASQTPQAFHEEERAKHSDPNVRYLLDTVFDLMPRMLANHTIASGFVCMAVLEEGSRLCGVAVTDDSLHDRLLWWYLWRLGDRMFRHQALEWVAHWARETNRSFRIYGNGWEKHPALSEFAFGAAQNGRELLCVYRASKVNLQLMPAGFIHQRALDGLAAGGFFLTRLVPQDLRGKTLRQLTARIQELAIATSQDLLSSTDERLRTLLRSYFGHRPLAPSLANSPLDLLRLIQINAELSCPDEVFPHFADIVFDSSSDFGHKADAFLADEKRRRLISQTMRQAALQHFSYRAVMDHFLRSMAGYLHIVCPNQ